MVRGRTGNDRGKLVAEEASGAAARVPENKTPADETVVAASDNVEKCVNCQFYDRRRARPADGKAPMWGQCRRHSPHLNPVSAKAYFVEGVWPLVRDDDWCGEWRVLTRTIDPLFDDRAEVLEENASAPSRPALVSSPPEVPMPAND